MRDFGDGFDVFNRAKEIRRLNQDAGRIRRDRFLQFFQISRPSSRKRNRRQRHALMMRIGRQHFAIFRMHAARDDHRAPSGEAHRHHHGFGGGGRTVVHGGVGHFHAGQFADHGLEFEDGLQRALRNLGLVGRVGGQKFAARDERIDDDRPVVGVGAGAEEAGVAVAVFAGALAEPVDDFRLRHLARDFEVAVQAVFGRNGRKQIIDRTRANGLQHGFAIGGRFRKISHRNSLDVTARGQFDCSQRSGSSSSR